MEKNGRCTALCMACPEGLEPPTYSLEGYCSIQLSYGQMGFELRGLLTVRKSPRLRQTHRLDHTCLWRRSAVRLRDFAEARVLRL